MSAPQTPVAQRAAWRRSRERRAAHLPIVPVLPAGLAAVLMLIDEQRRAEAGRGRPARCCCCSPAPRWCARPTRGPACRSYRLGNWPAPFGIVLVADRLSALMVLLAAVLGFAALLFSMARWDRAGPRFHALLQVLLMGVNGAFLTGDLFNLFVFFEVFLAASYGLALHGSGAARVQASLHYIVINLTASLLFLVGAALITTAQTGTRTRPTGAAHSGHGRAEPRAARSRRRGARHRVPDQGRHVAAVLLAAARLRRRLRAGRGAVRDPDQGGHLRGAADLAAVLRPGSRRDRPASARTG